MNTVARSPLKKPAVLALSLACVLLLGLGAAVLMSALFSQQANRFLDDWQAAGVQPGEQAWQIAHNAAEKALLWYPGESAAAYNTLGRVWEWQQYTLPTAAPEARPSRMAALEAYRNATQLRPTWPYTWVDLALVKLRLGEVDEELVNALEQGLQTGPWRSKSLARIAQVGLLSWWQLPQRGREITLEAVRRSLSFDNRSADQFWQQVEALGTQGIVCSALKAELAWLEKACP